jgi:uncharacterized membrane protein YdjX (TVP38/TMEM64 family)
MQRNRLFYKTLMIIFLVLAIGLFYYWGGADILDFSYIKQNLQEIQSQVRANPIRGLSIFVAAFLFLTILAIPGSLVLTILSGAIFGTYSGVLIVTICGTIGGTLSFLISRYLLKDYVNKKFHGQFLTINKNLHKDGAFYLFILRFIPVSPFVVINLVMGLTSLRVWTFFWTTFLGMLPGNIIYVFAGEKISEFDSPADIMSLSFLLSLTILGLLPIIARKMLKIRRKKMIHI